MAISEDVIVVGGGLAGSISALSAARAGASVRLISHKESTLRHASGLIDVLGYPDSEGEQPVVNPFDALDDLPDGHPYSVVGESGIREGLALFDEITGDLYVGEHTDRNALIPTQQGTVKPTARYPRSMAAGIGSDEREMLLVGFESLPDFDAPLAADHLGAAGVPFESRGVTVRFPADLRADAKLTRFGTELEREGTGALAETVEPHLDSAERVGFPALLGEENGAAVRASLESHLGIPVFELPGGPPSLPGLRLGDRLFEALDAAGVHLSTGVPVVGYEADGDRVTSVLVDRGGHTPHPYHASEFVLATGGLVGKGINTDRNGVHEPIFDCHVPHPEDRYDWFLERAFGDHPFARFGVVPDTELRPVDGHGNAEFENLRAAGSVLGGANIAAEKSGSGISLATGALTGRLTGEAI